MGRSLGRGAGELVQRVTKYFMKRLLRMVRHRRTRTVVFVLSQGRTVEYKHKEGDEEPTKLVKRRSHSDQQWIDMLKNADFGDPKIIFDESATRVASRWTRQSARQWREEEIHIT